REPAVQLPAHAVGEVGGAGGDVQAPGAGQLGAVLGAGEHLDAPAHDAAALQPLGELLGQGAGGEGGDVGAGGGRVEVGAHGDVRRGAGGRGPGDAPAAGGGVGEQPGGAEGGGEAAGGQAREPPEGAQPEPAQKVGELAQLGAPL